MSNYVVTTHNAADFSDDEISVDALLYNTIEAEVWPEDPVTPLQDAVAAARAVPDRVARHGMASCWSDRCKWPLTESTTTTPTSSDARSTCEAPIDAKELPPCCCST
jgi:hypothetical protein